MEPGIDEACAECGVPMTNQTHCLSCGAEKQDNSPLFIDPNSEENHHSTPTTQESAFPSDTIDQTSPPTQWSQNWPSAPGKSSLPEVVQKEEIAIDSQDIPGWLMEENPTFEDSNAPQGGSNRLSHATTLPQSSPKTENEFTNSRQDSGDDEMLDSERLPFTLPSNNEYPPSPDHEQNPEADSFRVRHLLFWGKGRSLFGIFIVNTFLTLMTLGVYSFWGRVRVREFLNSQTSFAGARFAYHGTGKELFMGWLKAILVFGLPYLFFSYMPVFWKEIPTLIPNVIAGLLFLCLIPVAVVGVHRYRLSRTSLRNIRFSFRGLTSDFMKLWFKGSLLSILTLGFYYPYFENARRSFLTIHSQIGNQAFKYDGQGKDLLKIYGKALGLFLLTIVVAGALFLVVPAFIGKSFTDLQAIFMATGFLVGMVIIAGIVPWFYLQAAKQRFFWGHTHLGEAQFFSTVTAWKLFELRVGHLVLLIATLGFAWPWVQVRNLQFFYFYLGLHGPLDFARMEQDALDASPIGDELAGFLDTGFDLG